MDETVFLSDRDPWQRLHIVDPAASAGPSTTAALRHNLPAQLPTMIGRDEAVKYICERLMSAQPGLLTLTGAGGTGKTRLAVAVGLSLLNQFSDGVWLVDLAALRDADLVASTVAASLGVREQPDRPIAATLGDILKPSSLLLILDNCEHLIEPCALLVKNLLQDCPSLRVLSTSRESLGVPGESLYTVPPLAAPELGTRLPSEQLVDYPAVRLFVERSQLVRPDFVLTAANSEAVVHICQSLDGLPLAIEMAAARLRSLTLDQIRAHLDDRFRLLVGGSRIADARQRTLLATLDWSYQLLLHSEQVLLRQLSIFAGGWTLEAAEQVCSTADIARDEVLEILSRLIDKSLVVAEEQGGTMRYRLLETVREYGLQMRAASSDFQAIRRRHAEFYVDFAERADCEIQGGNQAIWLERLDREHGNFRAALGFAIDNRDEVTGLRLAAALYGFWELRGHLTEGRRWLEDLLACPKAGEDPSTAHRIKAIRGAGVLAWQQGDYARAQALDEECLVLAREAGDAAGTAMALTNLAILARDQGDSERALALNQESLALACGIADKQVLALVLTNHAVLEKDFGEWDRASGLLNESLAIHRELGDIWGIALDLHSVGVLAMSQGEYHRAWELLEECVALRRELGDKRGVAIAMDGLAVAADAQDRPERAVTLFGAAAALRESTRAPRGPAERDSQDAILSALRARLGEQAFTRAWGAGRQSTSASSGLPVAAL